LKDVILFDEATSELDNESQEYIKKSIAKISIDHKVVIVAHRLSKIIDMDKIIVIDNGEVCGVGTHEMLLNSNKVYIRLYEAEAHNFKKAEKQFNIVYINS